MSVAVVIGAQWGDEGKGKLVDLAAENADLVIRFAGGANAGHTLVVNGEKRVLHLVPSGILHPKVRCLVGQGCVVDLGKLSEEIAALEEANIDTRGRLLIAERAHVVMPYHQQIDALRESQAGAIGTTKRGIGPAYEDKVARRGVRVGDVFSPRLEAIVERSLEAWAPVIRELGGEVPSLDETVSSVRTEAIQALAARVVDGALLAHETITENKHVLLEGAQGALLDVDHGTYPFVTSSSPCAGGACTGAGVAPTKITHVLGVTKAYATRVGNGPFPTQLDDEVGERIRKIGAEFGATTGRPRRCGWLDIPALKKAIAVNGFTSLALTKLDVLAGLEHIRICTGYEVEGEAVAWPPLDAAADVTPIYEELPGFGEEITETRSLDELPENARAYIRRVEELAGVPFSLISVGPDRAQTFGTFAPFS